MLRLQRLILDCSRSLPAFLLVCSGVALSLWLLLRISTQFAAVTNGYEPFDLQNGLQRADVLRQLPYYNADSRRLYWLFAIVDCCFPFLGSLLTSIAAAFLVRSLSPALFARLTAYGGFVWFFLPTLFDWSENLSIIALLLSREPTGFVGALLLFKQLKLLSLFVVQGSIITALLIWLVKLAANLLKQAKQ